MLPRQAGDIEMAGQVTTTSKSKRHGQELNKPRSGILLEKITWLRISTIPGPGLMHSM